LCWAMRISLHLPKALYEEARAVACARGTAIETLIEEGLRHMIAESDTASAFSLRKAAFKGAGLQPEFSAATWDEILTAAYGDRGGAAAPEC
jgi:hypothetical protein